MAKGKEALASANRRLEAAHAHIDRLTDEVVDAKMRARQHEASSRLVPVLRSEIESLKSQVENNTSTLLEKTTDERDRALGRLDSIVQYVAAIRTNYEKLLDGLIDPTSRGGSVARQDLERIVSFLEGEEVQVAWDDENRWLSASRARQLRTARN